MTTVTTKIYHTHDGIPEGYKSLGFGHNDARQTGGMWCYIGDKAVAEQMLEERRKVVKKMADDYYSSPWI